MNHAIILPILLPLFSGSVLLMAHRMPAALKRSLALLSTWALIPLALYLLCLANQGTLLGYQLGNWQAPFGIALLLDRLSALMLLLTAVLASAAVLYSCTGEDTEDSHFHGLWQFQLLGINGAFLTADLFNLFVFFEILLIASYALLVRGNRATRIKVGSPYVILNLLGSSLFLLGVGTLYGLLGSLNMADLATQISQANPADAPLLAAAGYLLLVVFALKAAVLPLGFWLPHTYAAASAPVAALFAIMSKVGLYAILRVLGLLYGAQAGVLAGFSQELLWWLAVGTLGFAVFGALSAKSLGVLVGYLVLVSVGTLLAGLSLGSASSIAGSLYYLVHSTLIAAALFLLSDLVAQQRADTGAALRTGPMLSQPLLLGGLFFVAAVSVAGLPPFSGFIGKVMLLQAFNESGRAGLMWPLLLIGGLALIIALSRAGSTLFWRMGDAPLRVRARVQPLLATSMLLLASVVLVLMAAPVLSYVEATAQQLLDTPAYMLLGGVR